jgi:hypothetical protein
MALTVPNDITSGATADAVALQSNFSAIESFVNGLQTTQISDDANAATATAAAITTAGTNANVHVNDDTAAHAASAVSFTDYGTITAANVQLVIQELKDELDAKDSAMDTRMDTVEGDVVEDLLVRDLAGTSSTTISSGTATNIGLSITVNPTKTSGVIEVNVRVDATCVSTSGPLVIYLLIDGAADGHQIVWKPGIAGARQTLSGHWAFPWSGAAAKTYSVQASRGGSDGSYTIDGSDHTMITGLFVG